MAFFDWKGALKGGAAGGVGGMAFGGPLGSGVGMLLGGLGGGFGMFGGGDDEKEQMQDPRMLEAPWQGEMRSLLTQYAKGQTPYYKRAGTLLDQYLEAEDMPALWGQAGQEVSRTLGGYYEPYIGQQYAPLRRQIEREREEASTRLGRQAQMVGMQRSTPYLGIESKLEQATLDQKLAALGQIYEAERGRQMQVAPLGAEMGKYEEESPLRKAEAAMAYEERPLQYAQSLLSGYTPTYMQPSYRQETGGMENLLGLLGSYMQGGGAVDFWNIGKGGTTGKAGSGFTGTDLSSSAMGGYMEQLGPLLQLAALSGGGF